jgi:hypothetical protein
MAVTKLDTAGRTVDLVDMVDMLGTKVVNLGALEALEVMEGEVAPVKEGVTADAAVTINLFPLFIDC